MEISPATIVDLRAIAEIHVEAWREAYKDILPGDYLASLSVEKREAMWLKIIEEGSSDLLVARTGQDACGWISFGPSRDTDAPPGRSEVYAVYVSPGHWSKGIGRALWQHAREVMKGGGRQSCSLWVFPENERAIRFYRTIGFLPDGSPSKAVEFGGRCLHEVRYVCLLDAG